MGKKASMKTVEERIIIRSEVEGKLRQMGISLDTFESLQPFKKVLEEYSIPVVLAGSTGRIHVPELGRYLEYVLPIRKWQEPMVRFSAADE